MCMEGKKRVSKGAWEIGPNPGSELAASEFDENPYLHGARCGPTGPVRAQTVLVITESLPIGVNTTSRG